MKFIRLSGREFEDAHNLSKITGILFVGLVLCRASSGMWAEAPLRLCEQNGRYVETGGGVPLFLVGYNAHNLDVDNSIGYERFLELNAQNRINYIRYFPSCGRMVDTKGDRRWQMFADAGPHKMDLGKWRKGFWPRITKHIAFMRDHGIVAHISLFEGCTQWKDNPFNAKFNINTEMGNVDRNGDGNGYEQGEFFDYEALVNPHATPEQKALKKYQERIVEKLLSTTSIFPNVMYEIGNELPNPGIKWVQYWVRFIRDRCDNLVTYNGSEGLTEADFDGATAHVHRESRVTTPFPEKLMAQRKFVGSSSDGAEITNIGSDGGRRCLWQAFAAGIGGWLNYSTDFYNNNADDYYYSAESPGRYNLRKGLYYYNAVGFIQDWGLPFPKMAPHQEVIVKKPAGTGAYCLSGEGEYVVYLVGRELAGELELNLKPASKHAYWFNPRTGAFCEHVIVKSGQNILPVPAEKQDMVFFAGRLRTEIRGFHIAGGDTASPTVEVELRNVGERLAKGSVRAEFSKDSLESFSVCKEVSIIGKNEPGEPLKVTIAKIPFDKPRAAGNWLRISVATESGRRAVCTIPVVGLNRAVVELGESTIGDGLMHVQNADGRTLPAVAAGRSCRRNAETSGRSPDRYFYFSVDNAFTYAGEDKHFELKVTYLDTPDGVLELQYDSQGEGLANIYHSAGAAPFSGTNRWITHTFRIDDAYFGDRQNVGADFRLYIGQDTTAYISRVELVKLASTN